MSDSVEQLYQLRFSSAELEKKKKLWKILCHNFFQKYIPPDATVVDIGAGYCEFINNIEAKLKFAVDLNPAISQYALPEVKCFNSRAEKLDFLQDGCADVVFMSNFLEHLENKSAVLAVLSESFRIIKPGGSLLVLQPNIKYLYKQYWDFFDHKVPLSDISLREALELAGFKIQLLFPRFLPYTTKGKLPWNDLLVTIYLKTRIAWKILGAQTFVIGIKP